MVADAPPWSTSQLPNPALTCEKGVQGGRALGRQPRTEDVRTDDLGTVVQPTVTHNVPQGADSTRPRLPSPEDDTGHARQHGSTSAHGAGLDGDGQRAAVQAPA